MSGPNLTSQLRAAWIKFRLNVHPSLPAVSDAPADIPDTTPQIIPDGYRRRAALGTGNNVPTCRDNHVRTGRVPEQYHLPLNLPEQRHISLILPMVVRNSWSLLRVTVSPTVVGLPTYSIDSSII